MNEQLLTVISNPEFWLSVAFFVVLILAIRPLNRYLKQWGQERADAVQKEINESIELRRQAEALLVEYTEKTKNKAKEKAAILQRAREEAAYLQSDANQKLQERLAKQDEDIAVRLKSVKQHGQKELKDKLLNAFVQQSHDLLVQANVQSQKSTQSDMDGALNLFFKTLDENADLLDKQSLTH